MHPFEHIPSFFVIRSLRTHARGGAQRGEQSGDDACNYLQDCFPAFFLHDSFVLMVNGLWFLRSEGLRHQALALRPFVSRCRCQSCFPS